MEQMKLILIIFWAAMWTRTLARTESDTKSFFILAVCVCMMVVLTFCNL